MTFAIATFGWIGLFATVILTGMTLVIWCEWACRQIIVSWGNAQGILFAIYTLIGLTLKPGPGGNAKIIAADLMHRYEKIEPEVAEEFERLLHNLRKNGSPYRSDA